MTLYIVDASVVVELLIAGPYTGHASSFLKGALRGDLFSVPEMCLNECTNVIWKAVRFRGMPLDQAEQTLNDLKALPLKRIATKAVLNLALAVGLRHELSVYDSLYIALAMRAEQPLVTLDEKQSRAAAAEGVTVVPVTRFTP